MNMKKILFICSANKDRSKTADDYFSEQFAEFEIDSAGTNLKLCNELGTQLLTKEHIERADIIIAMEEKHRKFIKKKHTNIDHNKIKVLHIKDRYRYFQNELIEILRQKVEPILNQL
jgi:predicted protein tyrosine phosphatase